MTKPVIIGDATLYHADCRDILPQLSNVDLFVTDPPYFKVKGDYWDNEWSDSANFLKWMSGIVELLSASMSFNWSLYLFASPKMHGRVESVIWQQMNVLSSIIWRKCDVGGKVSCAGNKMRKEDLRKYWPASERIVFAEHYDSDRAARVGSTYTSKIDELRSSVFEPIRQYLAEEWRRAGLTAKDANECTRTKMATHWFTGTQWALPTESNYKLLQARANKKVMRRNFQYLKKQFGFLNVEFQFLKKEYDTLKQEVDELRRYFGVTAADQWSDVWDFAPVQGYPNKHPCEKPQALLSHIIKASSKPDALIADAFMGTGSTGIAALRLGRRFIGIERDSKWFDAACKRIEAAQLELNAA